MKTYINTVIAYFKNQNIPFCKEDRSKSVFVLFEQGNVNIFNLFNFEDRLVTNWSIVSWKVPEKCKNEIIDFLISINSGLNGGRFYLDENTGCVAFSHSYIQAPKDKRLNRRSLENFCKEALEIMPRYHKAIYNAAFKSSNFKNTKLESVCI